MLSNSRVITCPPSCHTISINKNLATRVLRVIISHYGAIFCHTVPFWREKRGYMSTKPSNARPMPCRRASPNPSRGGACRHRGRVKGGLFFKSLPQLIRVAGSSGKINLPLLQPTRTQFSKGVSLASFEGGRGFES